jgi:alpha-N-arabinofuranosidase
MVATSLKLFTAFFRFTRLSLGVAFMLFSGLHAQVAGAPSTGGSALPHLEIDGSQIAARVSPTLYGLMTEEINYSYDGGLYGELVRNRIFKDDANAPVHWSVVQGKEGDGKITLDESQPLNDVLTTSLKLEVAETSGAHRVGVANDGYWGIPLGPGVHYRASLYAKVAHGFTGPLTITLESNDGGTVYARAEVSRLTEKWERYTVALAAGKTAPTTTGRLVISAQHPGTVWLNLVSLFPPTWHDRPNGNRIDLMKLLADMKPTFLRFPGGNYLEGDTIPTRFDWKKTLHDLTQRPGHQGPWSYRSSDGLGLLEFLEWCEDLEMEPVLAVYAGYSLKKDFIPAGPGLQPYVQDALDEIEYVTGDTSTPWGAQRARDGHPVPFKLTYVEIGNEDQFDRSGSYDGRYAQFHDAIKTHYPNLQVIATTKVTSRTPDVIDDHYYRNAEQMEADEHHYDHYSRTGAKIFVGEWATREGSPTPNLNAALGDAAWMIGMERNSDVIVMHCYAPLFVNVNPGAMQWHSDLIGYDTLTSYGSPSYHVQQMFSTNHGDVVLPIHSEHIPATEWQPPAQRGAQPPPPRQLPTFFFGATRNTKRGTLYLKVVNTAATAQSAQIDLKGMAAVAAEGRSTVLTSSSTTDTNSITEPRKIVPVTTVIKGLGASFAWSFAPYSVTILQLETR